MKQIEKDITLHASVSEVWEKWTTSTGLSSFFGVSNNMELAIGGAFEIYFSEDAAEGQRGSEGCKVLSFLPEAMLSFSWNAPPSIPEVRDAGIYTWVVLTFEVIDDNNTNVKLNHLGWKEGKAWDDTFNYFNAAWDYVLSSLEKSLLDK